MRRECSCLVVLCLIASLFPQPAQARTRKGDSLISQARRAELKDTTAALDEALHLAEAALETDRADIRYQLEVSRLRAFAAQYHVYEGQLFRDKGQIPEALAEFERAQKLDPASVVAPQELARTRALADQIRANPKASAEELLKRPLSRKNERDEKLYESAAPVPQLTVKLDKPLPIFRVNNQNSAEVYLAVAKETKLRVLFDPEYQPRPLGLNQSLDFQGASLDQALDYIALATKSFWKPLSGDTIFVTNDDPLRRSAFEEQVTKTFYLTNAPAAQEVTDIANTVQRVTDIKKLLVHASQGVIVARSDSDRLSLAEKIVADLDKPKAEIIIDVVILSVSKNWERQLGVNILGLADSTTTALFNPRGLLGATQSGGRTGIPLDAVTNLAHGDYNVNLPGAALNALLKIAGTKVLDKAQLRTIEGQKSVLKIGQRIPYATGSFSPGSFGGGSSLVNTQFQYFDIGLNIDVTAKVHEPDEVSLHIESDTSAVAERVDIGGIIQPVISQRKRVADVRVKEGEVNFWDIVTQRQDIRNTNGVPGLSQLPLVGRVFNNEKMIQSELQVLTLLVPHIIRAPDIRNVNLMGMPSGSDQVVRMRYSTAEDRAIAARTTDQVVDVTAAPGSPSAPGLPMQSQGMQGMGMQSQGMGMPQQNPGMGGMMHPNPGTGPGAQSPGPGPMGGPSVGMPGASPQPGVPMGPGITQPGPSPMGMGGMTPGATGVRVYFAPALLQIAMGQTGTTTLMLEGASQASGPLTLQFNAASLRLRAVNPGPGVSQVSSSPGSITLHLTAGAGPTLAQLTVEPLRTGQTVLGTMAARLPSPQGEVVLAPAPLTVEVLSSRASARPSSITALPVFTALGAAGR